MMAAFTILITPQSAEKGTGDTRKLTEAEANVCPSGGRVNSLLTAAVPAEGAILSLYLTHTIFLQNISAKESCTGVYLQQELFIVTHLILI